MFMRLATLCYVKRDGKILMMHVTKKGTHNGKWNGLGGKIEYGETPEEGVIREVLEESGLMIKNPRLHGMILFPDFYGPKDEELVFVFTATKFSGETKESYEGTLEWVEDNKLESLNMWDGDKIFLPWLESDKFFSAKFIYKDGHYVSHEVVFY